MVSNGVCVCVCVCVCIISLRWEYRTPINYISLIRKCVIEQSTTTLRSFLIPSSDEYNFDK